MSLRPSRSLKSLLQSMVIDNGDGTYTLDIIGESSTNRPKISDDTKSFFRKLLRDNGDGTFHLDANVGTSHNKVIDWIRSLDKFIQFDQTSYTGSAGGTVIVTIIITNATGDINIFNNIDFITAFLSVSGSAIIQTVQPVTFANGTANVTVFDAVAETVTIALSNPSKSTLDVTDTATITFT